VRSRSLWIRLSVLLITAGALLVVPPPTSSDAAIPNPTVLFSRDGTLIALGSAKYGTAQGTS